MTDATVNQYYTEDHERLHAAFRRFQSLKTGDHAKAIEAFQEFKTGLERHILWEEGILFPWFDQKSDRAGDCLTAALRREHGQILVYLDEISKKLAEGNFATGDEEAGLESVLRLHNQNEEDVFYPAMDRCLSDEQRAAVFACMKKRK